MKPKKPTRPADPDKSVTPSRPAAFLLRNPTPYKSICVMRPRGKMAITHVFVLDGILTIEVA